MNINAENALFVLLLLAQTTVIGLLFYRRMWQTLPVFCVYCIWDVTSNVGVFLISRYYTGEFLPVLFAQTMIDAALLLGVLVELAWSVLRPLRGSLPRSSVWLVGILILVAGAAIWPFAALPGLAHSASKELLLCAQIQQTMSILRILFFLVLAGASQLLSIGWRDRELQIATGLGVFSIIALTVAVLQTHGATVSQFKILYRVEVAGYACCSLYWIFSFAQKVAERREFTPQMRSFLLAAAGATRTTRIAMTESRKDKSERDDR